MFFASSLCAQTEDSASLGAPLRYEVIPKQTEIPLDGQLDVETKLTNVSEKPVTVYWGRADPQVHRFEIRNQQTGRRLPVRRGSQMEVPQFGAKEHFCVVPSGDTLSLSISLANT